MEALAPHTNELFDKVAQLESIKPFADIKAIGAMKMEVLLCRSNFGIIPIFTPYSSTE